VSDDEHELSPRGEEAAEALLEITGEILKLGVRLLELPAHEIELLNKRLGVFFSVIENLPVQPESDGDVIGKTEGEA
jgi:hypothetical protein